MASSNHDSRQSAEYRDQRAERGHGGETHRSGGIMTVIKTGPFRSGLLGIYLNDHLAGATAGSELAHRMARSHPGREEAAAVSR